MTTDKTDKTGKISTPTDPDHVEVIDAEGDVEKAAAKALKGGVKTNDDGLVIGLDGKNPVSNINPHPGAVQGTRPF